MTSIFSASFLENQARIYKKISEHTREKSLEKDPFPRVLGDLRQAKDASSSKTEGTLERLSNLSKLVKSELDQTNKENQKERNTATPPFSEFLSNAQCVINPLAALFSYEKNLTPVSYNRARDLLPNAVSRINTSKVTQTFDPAIITNDIKPKVSEPVNTNPAPKPVLPELDTASLLPEAPSLILSEPRTTIRAKNTFENRTEDIAEIIARAGEAHGIDSNLSLAVAKAESSLRPNAVSNDGHSTKGIFQLLDSTGKEMLKRLGLNEQYDPFNPSLNSYLGVGYLKRLHNLFSKETQLIRGLNTIAASDTKELEKLALAAFNAGEGRVALAQAKAEDQGRNPALYDDISRYLPQSTRDYVEKVFKIRAELDSSGNTNTVV